jgi:hypothetical protein
LHRRLLVICCPTMNKFAGALCAPRRLLPPHPNLLPHWGRGGKVELI